MICKAGHYEPIAREGFVFIIPMMAISFILWWTGYLWGSFAVLLLSVAIALFFRNPERIPPRGDGIVLSPADGRVVEIVQQVGSTNMPGVQLKRVSIFMSLFDVHVNRWPISGTVVKIRHVPGRFLDAREPAASEINEHNSVVSAGTRQFHRGGSDCREDRPENCLLGRGRGPSRSGRPVRVDPVRIALGRLPSR